MRPAFDPVAVVERGYDAQPTLDSWLEEVAKALGPAIDLDEIGVLYYFHEQGACYGSPPGWIAGKRSPFRDALDAACFGESVYKTIPAEDNQRITTSVRKLGLSTLSADLAAPIADMGALGLRDAVAVTVPATQGRVVLFSSVMRSCFAPDRSLHSLFRRIVAHLGAGLRLCASKSGPALESADVECILSPAGDVLHAAADARGEEAREYLRKAVRDVDRARSRRGRADPMAALELWRGLFAGRWSVVDYFDSDGRRYILARSNPLDAGQATRLPLRQRQVLFFVSAGWSNKEVGYALGIDASTVAIHLRRALSTLGLHSRLDWIRLSSASVE